MAIVVFKGEDFDEEAGEDIGPAIVTDDAGSFHDDQGWMTRSEAKALAAELSYRFELDAPSDEELADFKRRHGYA